MAIDYRTAGDALIVTRSPSPTGSTIFYIYGPTSLVGSRPSRIRYARREWSLLSRIVSAAEVSE